MHSYPSACRGPINLLKQEPSAQRPWQNTILGFVILFSLVATHTMTKRHLSDARFPLKDANFVEGCPAGRRIAWTMEG